ncbi:MAG: hypothetical protein ABI273_03550 [Lacunisphaera sp.]
MRKLLNKPWFAAVLALAAIVAVATAFLPGGGKFKMSGLGLSADSADASASTDGELKLSRWAMVQKIQVPINFRDPFAVKTRAVDNIVEKAPEPDAVDTVHLSALWIQGGRTLALINDRICETGDQIGHLKFESATQDGVWLSHWNGRNFLKVGGDFTLNTPAKQLARMLGSL